MTKGKIAIATCAVLLSLGVSTGQTEAATPIVKSEQQPIILKIPALSDTGIISITKRDPGDVGP